VIPAFDESSEGLPKTAVSRIGQGKGAKMNAVAQIFAALLVLLGASHFVLKEIHDEVRLHAIRKIEYGFPSLEAYTKRLIGKKHASDKFHSFDPSPKVESTKRRNHSSQNMIPVK